jgi:regulator of protease activity HflC (stomatin/prohibitin superfamily)
LLVQTLWILVLLAILLVILYKVIPLKRTTIFEYQRGLKYTKGRYVETLGPGQYWVLPAFTSIAPVDVRSESVSITGQDVLSADGVTVKLSIAAEFEIFDPHLAINKNANFRSALYLALQISLREIVGKEKIEELLQNRAGIGPKLLDLTSTKASALGVKLKLADVKDLMFAGDMKKAFAQVVKAQKEGQAALEKARGETAALRSLANAARMMDDNPNLLQLRALQALEASNGNTLVLGLPTNLVPLAKKLGRPGMSEPAGQEGEK